MLLRYAYFEEANDWGENLTPHFIDQISEEHEMGEGETKF